MPNIIRYLQTNYFEFILTQAPHWLIIDDIKHTTKINTTPKTASAVVIVIIWKYSLKPLQMT